MENTPLHAQKLAILSRLIKADQLTLEEALLLLKDEQEAPVIQPWQTPTYPRTSPYWYGSPTIITSSSGTNLFNGGNSSMTFMDTGTPSTLTSN